MKDITACYRVAEAKISQQRIWKKLCKKLCNKLKYCVICKTRMRTKQKLLGLGKNRVGQMTRSQKYYCCGLICFPSNVSHSGCLYHKCFCQFLTVWLSLCLILHYFDNIEHYIQVILWHPLVSFQLCTCSSFSLVFDN